MHTRAVAHWRVMFTIVCVLTGAAHVNAQMILNFEDADIPTGSKIVGQYGPRGVIFQSAYVETDAAAHSGTRVLRAVKTGDEVFEVLPLVVKFISPQVRVKLFAGSQLGSLNGRLTAFDSLGNVIDTDGPHLVPQNTFTTSFQITAATASIDRVELQLEGSSFASIDDLEFEGMATPPPPTQAPIVQLTQPPNGIDVDIPGDLPRLPIAGTVTGEGLLPQVTVTVAYKQPPESATLPPLTLVLELTGTGTTRQFSLAGGMTPLPLGPITVTATAENIGALTGTATSTLTNLPRAVRDRFGNDGGAAVYGDFQYGLLDPCPIAVYEHGAIGGRTGRAIAVHGDVFSKWVSLRGPSNESGWFGCPTNEEGDTLAGARSQPFDRGRIYARLPDVAPSAAFYLPRVFMDALDNVSCDPDVLKNRPEGTDIDSRCGDEGIGLPLSDPVDAPGATRTWLFQRFHRVDDENKALLPSTMEIRGSPPVLWIERQAGLWLQGNGLYSDTFVLSEYDKKRLKTGATWWQGFDCEGGNLGPCTVPTKSVFPPPIAPDDQPDFKNQFCSGTTYSPGRSSPPEWKAIRGQYDAIPVFGAVISAHMTNIDNGLTHQTHNGTCPKPSWVPVVGAVVLTPPGAAVANVLADQEDGLTCVSDFEFFVRPLGPMIDTRPQLPSLFGDNNKDSIKTEYEIAFAAAAHNFLGPPASGDLVHMTGRWIVDCGHVPYKTELHPLFSFARMKTVVSETNTFTGCEEPLFGNKPAPPPACEEPGSAETPGTRIAIWVNGWYPGGDDNAIEFDVFPPPRPSPTALLHVIKPVDSGPGNYRAAIDVRLDWAMQPVAGSATKVHLRFTAPQRENEVTPDGEMLFMPGRGYWGIWYLYWGN